MHPDASSIDSLKAFPFLNSDTIIDNLKSELPTYLAHAVDVSSDTDTLVWWQGESNHMPFWADAFCKILLIQPSSAAAERIFSILNNNFGSYQDLSLQDYIESSLMLQNLQYNRK